MTRAVGLRPAAVGLQPAAVGLRPAAVGLRPSAVGLRPATVGLRPSVGGLRPGTIGLRLAKVGLRLAALAVAAGCGDDAPPLEPTSVVDELELGTFTPDTTGHTERIAPPIPADAVGWSLLIESEGPALLSARLELGGAVITNELGPLFSINRLLPEIGAVALAVPGSPEVGPAAGAFTVSALYEDTAAPFPVRLRLFAKRAPAEPERQLLPLHVFLIGSVAHDEALDRALATLRRILARGRIELLDPTFTTVGAPVSDAFTVVDVSEGLDAPDLRALLALSARAPGPGLCLFLVPSLEASSAAGFLVFGIAGGIPVPPVQGTGHSGVAVNAAALAEAPDFTGQTVAHEVGHALGLYHTTELDGALSDPLSDTPACTPAHDADGDGLLSPDECAGAGGDNLMFWTATSLSQTALTEDQRFVLLHDVLTR